MIKGNRLGCCVSKYHKQVRLMRSIMMKDSAPESEEAVVKIRDLMTEVVISLDPEESVMRAARLMEENHISSVLVSHQGEFSGIITDHDIISRVVAKGLDPTKISVNAVMSCPLITISEEAAIDDAAKKMAEKRVRRLIVERGAKKVGIIGESDIIRIEPELHFLIRERSKLKALSGPTESRQITLAGYCEECGNFASQLRRVDGEWLDEECAAG